MGAGGGLRPTPRRAGRAQATEDLEQGVIFVHGQRAVASGEVNGGVVEKEPKGKSKRSIAIGPAVVGVIREHLERQDKEIAEAEGAYRQRG